MNWIGQHIWSFISRFRDDVYLEDIDTGTITGGGNLGLDSNSKIVKATTEFTPTLSLISDCAIEAVPGTEYVITDANGGAMTLPSVYQGARIVIYIGYPVTSNTITITAQSGDLLKGYAFMSSDSTQNTQSYVGPDGTDDLIITLNGTTTGGRVGDRIELVGMSDSEWRVRARLSYTGTLGATFS